MEYMYAQTSADLRWTRAIADDLRSGRLTWSDEWMRKMAQELGEKHEEQGGQR
jgi:hypothetical protein